MKMIEQTGLGQEVKEKSINLAWHYTTGENFYKIVGTGLLLPSDINLDPGESPVLWFSKNQAWESTSRKMVRQGKGSFRILSKRETAKLGRGLVRFGYRSDDLLDWTVLPKLAGMHSARVRALEVVGRNQGANPSDWMGRLTPLDVRDLVIDVMDKKQGWTRVQTPR